MQHPNQPSSFGYTQTIDSLFCSAPSASPIDLFLFPWILHSSLEGNPPDTIRMWIFAAFFDYSNDLSNVQTTSSTKLVIDSNNSITGFQSLPVSERIFCYLSDGYCSLINRSTAYLKAKFLIRGFPFKKNGYVFFSVRAKGRFYSVESVSNLSSFICQSLRFFWTIRNQLIPFL